jgi:biopolymer transport protein ExbD
MLVRKALFAMFLLAGLTFLGAAQTPENRASSKPPDLNITVHADDASMDISSVVEIIDRARSSEATSIKLVLPHGITLVVPPRVPDDQAINVKPNPLLLLVSVDANGNLDLNREKHGDLSDTASLVVRLVEIFKRREVNGVFRGNSNDVEKSVGIRLVNTLKVSDLETVATAVRDSGCDLITLSVDDDSSVERRELVPYVPPKPKRKPRRPL